MSGHYLGEEDVDVGQTPFAMYGPSDWALWFIEHYSQIDGAHHKTWVLDQVARILKGGTVKVREARWADGNSEYRITIVPSPAYHEWVREMCAGEDGPETYDYDEGIAP